MKIIEALSLAGIDTADGEYLLAYSLAKDRTWVIAHPEYELTEGEENAWKARAERRRVGEPLAYITGEKYFLNLPFIVTSDVLVPRFATESLLGEGIRVLQEPPDIPYTCITEIDAHIVCAISLWKSLHNASCIVDIGTGSGVIAICLARIFPHMRIIGTDVSKAALEVAQKNADRHEAHVHFRQGSGLAPVQDLTEPFLIISNPPYIPEGTELSQDVMHEPYNALFGGKDGADIVRSIMHDAKAHPHCCGVVMECRQEQAQFVTNQTSSSNTTQR